jgi:hypothetical protein
LSTRDLPETPLRIGVVVAPVNAFAWVAPFCYSWV